MNDKPVPDDLNELRHQLKESSFREAVEGARQQDRKIQQERKGRTWQSLKTLAGWTALTLLAGSALWDIAGRLISAIGRR